MSMFWIEYQYWDTCGSCLEQIEAKDVGNIFKIRIGHDGSGTGSGWYLEKVDLKYLVMAMVKKEKKEDKKKNKKKKKKEEEEDEDDEEVMQEVVKTLTFPCDRWLAEDEEDGELIVELIPEDSEELEGKEMPQNISSSIAISLYLFILLYTLAVYFIVPSCKSDLWWFGLSITIDQ